jgi:hypothetical protein
MIFWPRRISIFIKLLNLWHVTRQKKHYIVMLTCWSFNIRNVGKYILALLSLQWQRIEHEKEDYNFKAMGEKIQPKWNLFRSMQNDGKSIFLN